MKEKVLFFVINQADGFGIGPFKDAETAVSAAKAFMALEVQLFGPEKADPFGVATVTTFSEPLTPEKVAELANEAGFGGLSNDEMFDRVKDEVGPKLAEYRERREAAKRSRAAGVAGAKTDDYEPTGYL